MLEISSIVIEWIFFAYMSYRIGLKLHIQKSYPWYLIPLWNFWILAKESDIQLKKFFLTLLLLLSISLVIGWLFYIDFCNPSLISIIGGADGPTSIFIANRLAPELIVKYFIANIILFVIAIFWGNVAKKMGKEYGVYVLFGLVSIYLPPLLLVFETLDRWITSNRLQLVYSPLVGEEKEVWDRVNSVSKERVNRVVSVGVLLLILLSILWVLDFNFSISLYCA